MARLELLRCEPPVYDAWVTYDSGGFDLEAIGVLQPQEYGGDINLDGLLTARIWISLRIAG